MDAQLVAESNLTRLLAVTDIIHALALLCVGLLVYGRVSLLRPFGRDDAAIVVASVRVDLDHCTHGLTNYRSWRLVDGFVLLYKATTVLVDIAMLFPSTT